jgi:ATP-dependent DNA helicase RecQ
MTEILRDRALKILQSVFGYPAFRGQQSEIVELVANGQDLVAVVSYRR